MELTTLMHPGYGIDTTLMPLLERERVSDNQSVKSKNTYAALRKNSFTQGILQIPSFNQLANKNQSLNKMHMATGNHFLATSAVIL
jgi:hypothetical protein